MNQHIKAEDVSRGDKIIRQGVTVGIIANSHIRQWDGREYHNRYRIRGVNPANGEFLVWLAEPKEAFKISSS